MWRDPPVVIDTKKVLKPDPSASTIRRQQSVRRRARGGDTRSNPRERYQSSYGNTSRVDPRPFFDIIRRDHEARIAGDIDERSLADVERLEASNRRRLESGRALLRDALSYEQPSQRMRMRESGLRYEMPPPVPSAPDGPDTIAPYRVEVETLASTGYHSPFRYMPTPPYASGSLSPDSSSHPTSGYHTTLPPSTASNTRIPSRTPRFAPAYGSHTNTDITTGPRDIRRMRRTRHIHRDPGPYARDRNHDSIPVLTLTHHSGLGDRGRSVSPFTSSSEEDSWDTLLTTITPDERLPTPSSSFNSQPVSVSFSSNSTQPTSTMSSQNAPPFNIMAPLICDSPPTSDDELISLPTPPPPDPSRYSENIVARIQDLGRSVHDQGRRMLRRMAPELEPIDDSDLISLPSPLSPRPDTHPHQPGPADLAAQEDDENELLLQEMISQLDEEDEDALWGEMRVGLEQMRNRLIDIERREEIGRQMEAVRNARGQGDGVEGGTIWNESESREFRSRLAWLNDRLVRVGELTGRGREGRERL
jgi:hypothetical protein